MGCCSRWFSIIVFVGLLNVTVAQEVLGIRLEELKEWGKVIFATWQQGVRILGEDPCAPLHFVNPKLDTTGQWCPGTHQSIETALQEVPELRGILATSISLSYDYEHTRQTIKTEEDMVRYLQRSQNYRQQHKNWPLYVSVVAPLGQFSMASAFSMISDKAQKMSEKLVATFTKMVSTKVVEPDALAADEDNVKKLTKVNQLTVQGDVKKFDGVPVHEWENTVKVLQEKVKVPEKITSTLALASKFNRGLQETAYSLSYKDGTLEAAYFVRLIAKKTPMGDLNLVVFYFTLAFVNSMVKQIGFDENLAIEKYVESKAHSFWKDKLAPDVTADIMDEL